MRKDLEEKLIKEFPQLFQDVDKPNTQSLMCYGCECGPGWYELLRRTCQKIMATDPDPDLRFSQIKEKWGQLRIYMAPHDEGVSKILEDAEVESCKICEKCGATEGVKLVNNGWMLHLCSKCQEERNK